MRKRWLVNFILLLLVAGIATLLYLRPKPEVKTEKTYALSSKKLSDFSKLSIEFPTKAPVVFEKKNGLWRMVKPYDARANQSSVQRILSIIAATSKEKFPVDNRAQFGLDKPALKVKLDDQEIDFGTYNPVSSDQYVAYKDAIYMVSSTYSEAASIQPLELIDKAILKPGEKPVAFDLSHLEQWEDIRLHVDLENGKWKISTPKAQPSQDKMNQWLDIYWNHAEAKSVEPYTPDHKTTYPSLDITMQDGSKVHLDKIQESPELLLGRPDEGMLYHFAPDFGFTMLNPPIGLIK